MSKYLLHVCIFLFSFSLAGYPGLTYANNIPPAEIRKCLQGNEIRGVVDSVTLEDHTSNVRPKISIIGIGGHKHTFIIRPTTTIYDRQWKPVTLDKLRRGQYVRIRYKLSKDGYKIAVSIKPSGIIQPSLPAS